MNKRKLKILVFISVLCTLNSCGNKENETELDTQNAGENDTISSLEEHLVDESIIDPKTFDFSKEIQAADLHKSLSLLYLKSIKMVVYPSFLYDGATLQNGGYAGSKPGMCHNSSDCDVYVSFEESYDSVLLKENMALLIEGGVELSIYQDGFSRLYIDDARLLGAANIPNAINFNPQTFDTSVIYQPKSIIDYFLSWKNQEIIVVGDFLGTTISKSADQTKLLEARIDVGSSYSEKVGCVFETEDETQAFEPGEKGVKIKGKINIEEILGFGAIKINQCHRLN